MCRSLQLKRYNSNNSYQLWAAGWSWRQNFPILKSNLRVKIPLIDRYLRFGQQTGMLQNCLHFNKFYSLTFARKLGTLFIWSLFSVKLLRDKIAFGWFRNWNLKRQKDFFPNVLKFKFKYIQSYSLQISSINFNVHQSVTSPMRGGHSCKDVAIIVQTKYLLPPIQLP